MRNSRGLTLIGLMIAIVIVGIIAVIAIPNFMAMQARIKEAGVKSNCNTVKLAMEEYAVKNDGNLPNQSSLVTDLLPFLPGGKKLVNPFTRKATEPVVGTATEPGQTAVAIQRESGNVGYTITGFGLKGLVITLISNPPIDPRNYAL